MRDVTWLDSNNEAWPRAGCVTAFVGLAAVLILVSFLYQRFMTGKDEEDKREGLR